MEKRKAGVKSKIGLDVYIITTVISTLLFITGILLGITISGQRVNILDGEINYLRDSIENIELEFLFLDMMAGNISCSYFIGEANRLAVDSTELGASVDLYEQTQRWDDPTYLSLKSRYMLVTVRDWLMLEKIKKTCLGNYTTILYFYGSECPECATQGFVLTYLKDKYPQQVMVFSLDTGLDVPIVNALKTSYNVTEYPSIVVDNKRYSGFVNTTYLEEDILGLV